MSTCWVVSGGVVTSRVEPFDPYPQYSFGYSVQDPLTGDIKGQSETRQGSLVQGQYSLVEPDGSLRTVTYVADDNGFNAVVDRQPSGVSVVKAKAFAVPSAPILPAASIQHPITALPPLGSHQVVAIQPPRPIRPVVIQPQRPPPQIIVSQPRPPSQIVVNQPRPPFQPVAQQPIQAVPAPDNSLPVVVPLPPQQQQPGITLPPSNPPAQQDPVCDFDCDSAIQIQNEDLINDEPEVAPAPPQPQPTLPPPPPPTTTQRPRPPPQQIVQQPIQQQRPVTPPQQQQFEDTNNVEEDAIEISADGRSGRAAGPSRNGGGSGFTYSSSRGNQFNFRVVV